MLLSLRKKFSYSFFFLNNRIRGVVDIGMWSFLIGSQWLVIRNFSVSSYAYERIGQHYSKHSCKGGFLKCSVMGEIKTN
jgi:hypothetical protein